MGVPKNLSNVYNQQKYGRRYFGDGKDDNQLRDYVLEHYHFWTHVFGKILEAESEGTVDSEEVFTLIKKAVRVSNKDAAFVMIGDKKVTRKKATKIINEWRKKHEK